MVLEYYPQKTNNSRLSTTILSLNTIYDGITYSYILYSLLFPVTKFKLIKPIGIKYLALLSTSSMAAKNYYFINYKNETIESLAKEAQSDHEKNLRDNFISLGFLSGSTLAVISPLPFFKTIYLNGLLFYGLFLINHQILKPFGYDIKFN